METFLAVQKQPQAAGEVAETVATRALRLGALRCSRLQTRGPNATTRQFNSV